jgi:uncharacterized coiled-coil DUF342 family protein
MTEGSLFFLLAQLERKRQKSDEDQAPTPSDIEALDTLKQQYEERIKELQSQVGHALFDAGRERDRNQRLERECTDLRAAALRVDTSGPIFRELEKLREEHAKVRGELAGACEERDQLRKRANEISQTVSDLYVERETHERKRRTAVANEAALKIHAAVRKFVPHTTAGYGEFMAEIVKESDRMRVGAILGPF